MAHLPRIFRPVPAAQIKGMEEGLHSMKVGGKRRIIMPQGLGYTVQGLGPYPADPRKRDVLVQVNTASYLVTLCGSALFHGAQVSHSIPESDGRGRGSHACPSILCLRPTVDEHSSLRPPAALCNNVYKIVGQMGWLSGVVLDVSYHLC